MKIINNILEIELNDGAIFEVDDISLIREEDEYGGYRVSLTVKIDNMRESFHFDVATGDPITPKEIDYNYSPIIGKKTIKVLTYNLETVLAEKLETILTRGEKNSRMKDFYDVYLIMALKKDELNLKHLEQAVYNTFKKRNFTSDVENILTSISDSKILKIKW